MKRITEHELAELKASIAEQLAAIPNRHTRQRRRLPGDMWQAALANLEDDGTTVDDNVGARAIYWKRANQGTAKWPDYYTGVEWVTYVFEGDRRSNLVLVVHDDVEGCELAFERKSSVHPDYKDPWDVIYDYLESTHAASDYYIPAIMSGLCEIDSNGNPVFARDAYKPGVFMNVIEGAEIVEVEYILEQTSNNIHGPVVYHGTNESDLCEDYVSFCEERDLEPGIIETGDDVIDAVDDANQWRLRLEVRVHTKDNKVYSDYYGRWSF